MRKVILTDVSIKGWVVYLYKHGLFDCCGKALPLSAYYAEVVQWSGVASGGLVAIMGKDALR